jgi:hypothetical protein
MKIVGCISHHLNAHIIFLHLPPAAQQAAALREIHVHMLPSVLSWLDFGNVAFLIPGM